MIRWFAQIAPIKLKLTIAFGALSALIAALAVVIAYESQRMSAAAASSDVATLQAALHSGGGGVIFAIVALAASLVLGWWANNVISTPYVSIVARMEAMASGDLESPVRFADHRDCVGRIARAMHAFKEAISNGRLSDAQAAEIRAEAAAAHAEAERVQNEERNTVVVALEGSLQRLAKGDLTARIEAAFTERYRQIKEDYNRAIESLSSTVGEISGATDSLRGGAGEIASASDDLSRRTEQQAATLEQTAAALDEITATVKRSAEGAKQATAAASGAKSDAVKSGEVVREAVTAMAEIEQSSRQVSQIIGVIDEIAFQTNLLALNAGVEAARAGDAGRGFAVVAQEVRALAQRSAEAAKEIKGLIANSSGQVERGVRLVGDTGHALTAIAEKVTEIDALISEIAHSAQEQAIGLTQVNTAVNQMDQVTQQNAAMVEEATAAAANLRMDVDRLDVLVARFRTEGSARSRPEAASPGRHQPAHNPVAQSRAKVAQFARGGAAAAVAPNDWEEF